MAREKHENAVELGTLALVDRHCIDRLMEGETHRGNFAHPATRGREENAGGVPGLRIGKDDTHIAVEKLQVIVVDRDHHRAPPVPAAVQVDQALFGKDILHDRVDAGNSVGPLAQRAEDAEGVKAFQCLGR